MFDYKQDQMLSILGANGEPRRLHVWGDQDPKAIFIAIHGGMAHGADFVNLGLHFRERGITTIAMDQRGHVGVDRVHVPDFNDYLADLDVLLNWAGQRFAHLPMVLVAHSMGALIASVHRLQGRKLPLNVVGYVMSSPFYAPVEPIPAIKRLSSAAISKVFPSIAVPMDDFTQQLTHDANVSSRIASELESKRRAGEISLKSAYEMIKAQDFVKSQFDTWDMPSLYLVAGDECLADPKVTKEVVKRADQQLIEYHVFEENYHENFNELNRSDIFRVIETWFDALVDTELAGWHDVPSANCG